MSLIFAAGRAPMTNAHPLMLSTRTLLARLIPLKLVASRSFGIVLTSRYEAEDLLQHRPLLRSPRQRQLDLQPFVQRQCRHLLRHRHPLRKGTLALGNLAPMFLTVARSGAIVVQAPLTAMQTRLGKQVGVRETRQELRFRLPCQQLRQL